MLVDEGESTLANVKKEKKGNLENLDFDNVTVTDLKMRIKVGGKRNLSKEEEEVRNCPRKRRRKGDERENDEEDDLDNVDIESIAEDDISDCYRDVVRVDCRICGDKFELDLFNSHLMLHGIDVDDYIRAYIDPNLIRSQEPQSNGRRLISLLGAPQNSLKYHRCHICEQIFLFTKERLREHLAVHKVPLRGYERKRFVFSDYKKFSTNLSEEDAIFSNDYEDECLTLCSMCNRSSHPYCEFLPYLSHFRCLSVTPLTSYPFLNL